MYHNRMLSISNWDRLSPRSFVLMHIFAVLINYYAHRKYRSDVRLYDTANYELNKGAIFFFLPAGEHGIERSLVWGEEKKRNPRRFYLPR